MFNKNVEELPASQADNVLKNQRRRLNQNKPDCFATRSEIPEKMDTCKCILKVDDTKSYNHTGTLGYNGSISGTIKTNFRQTEFSVNKTIIKKNICRCFCKCAYYQKTALIGTYQ